MLHGVGFLQYLRDERPRGASQFGSVNWLMGQMRRPAGGGSVALRGMLSLDPLTIRGCGYPDLLASGEICDGAAIVDRQHPHDLILEAALLYTRPIAANVSVQLYGAPAGEPALGPVAFPHRVSALMNPLAPVSHHWLDATHLSYGVVTGGILGNRWKAEASLFNGREPDESRFDLDLAPLDSYSGRVAFLPSSRWSLQLSAGHLEEAEEQAHGDERVDVDRVTASAIYHRPVAGGGIVATTLAWGRNREEHETTHAWLTEATLSVVDRHVGFARFEVAQKTAHDLDLHDTDDLFTVGKLQLGYTYYLRPVAGWRVGAGGSVSVGMLPRGLAPVYGGRAPLGFGVFLSVRPAAMMMM